VGGVKLATLFTFSLLFGLLLLFDLVGKHHVVHMLRVDLVLTIQLGLLFGNEILSISIERIVFQLLG